MRGGIRSQRPGSPGRGRGSRGRGCGRSRSCGIWLNARRRDRDQRNPIHLKGRRGAHRWRLSATGRDGQGICAGARALWYNKRLAKRAIVTRGRRPQRNARSTIGWLPDQVHIGASRVEIRADHGRLLTRFRDSWRH